jgi:hypothetical protein
MRTGRGFIDDFNVDPLSVIVVGSWFDSIKHPVHLVQKRRLSATSRIGGMVPGESELAFYALGVPANAR